MARFSEGTIERVKEAVDMAALVGARTDLRRQGGRMNGRCPFHDDRSPSFSVDLSLKLYHCFGCGASGDAITFVEETEGLDFAGAVEVLAERYGVEVEREKEDPRVEAARKGRERLRTVLDRAARFYFRVLMEREDGREALAYLEGRGLGKEVLAAFRVGFAPLGGNELVRAALGQGFSDAELVKAGLGRRGRGGDYFRGRITFPIADHRGRVVGFGARAMSAEERAKYVNSPDSELFSKKSIVYGIDRARAAIAKKGRAIVVEGYTDVLAAHQAGIEEAVAVMGTAITGEQLGRLSGQATTVVLAMDADRAGQDAMVRAQRVAQEKRMRLMVATLPEGQDPCDLIQAEGPERFLELIDGAVDLAEFRVRMALGRADLETAYGRGEALREVGPMIAALPESVARTELERLAADRLLVDAAQVRAAMSGGGQAADMPAQERAPTRKAPTARPLTPAERRETALLALCVAAPDVGQGYLDRLTREHLGSGAAMRAVEWLRGHLSAPLEGLSREDEEMFGIVSAATLAAERMPAAPGTVEIAFLQIEEARLTAAIEAARGAGDEQRQSDLVRERNELRARIRAVADDG